MKNKNFAGYGGFALIILTILILLTLIKPDNSLNKVQYGYTDFINEIQKVEKIEIRQGADEVPTATVKVYYKDLPNVTKEFIVPNASLIQEDMKDYPTVNVYFTYVKPSIIITILPSLIVLIAVILLFLFIMNQAAGGGANKAMSFGKSRAKMVVDQKAITFKNVAGLDEEKGELEEIVEFLKSPKKYNDLGARIPTGVLLEGPPGTGKTLIAKAVAGEAKVPFFTISGSEFVELYVGVGASRVRDLFDQAKKSAPCIIFIDEIDAVGRRRGAGLGGGHDEREQTLNQLLVEMDGFEPNSGIIILAATNRIDILDPALLRPGRFDRKVTIGKPDVKGREDILKVHAKGKPLSDEVDLKTVAQTTAGFTGADLANLLNEAAIFAARSNRKVLVPEDFQNALIKIGFGTEKKNKVISQKDKVSTAYHEAGHAIMFHVLSELDPVHSVTIVPTGAAGGYTQSRPTNDVSYYSKTFCEQTLIALLGGRAAEKLIFDEVSSGAYSDIKRASALARNMVASFGMSELLGPIDFSGDGDEVFIGRDWGHAKKYGENVSATIDAEVKKFIDQAHENAMQLLDQYRDVLDKIVIMLLEKERIYEADIDLAFGFKKVNGDDVTHPIVEKMMQLISDKRQLIEEQQ